MEFVIKNSVYFIICNNTTPYQWNHNKCGYEYLCTHFFQRTVVKPYQHAIGTFKTRTQLAWRSFHHSLVICIPPIAHFLWAFLPDKVHGTEWTKSPQNVGKANPKDFCWIRCIEGISSSWKRKQYKPRHWNRKRMWAVGIRWARVGWKN